MREFYRCNKDIFPQEGAILYIVKKSAERDQIIAEMVEAAREIMSKLHVSGEQGR